MKRIVRLTESDLTRIVRRVIMEQEQTTTLEKLEGFNQLIKGSNSVKAVNRYKLGSKYYVFVKGSGGGTYYACDGTKKQGVMKKNEAGGIKFVPVGPYTLTKTEPLDNFYCKGNPEELKSSYGVPEGTTLLTLTDPNSGYQSIVTYDGISDHNRAHSFSNKTKDKKRTFNTFYFNCSPKFKIFDLLGEDITSKITYADTIKKYCPAV